MSLYWYDFETFGADPFRDRPAQFAGIRTDNELNIIGEPLVVYCKPADDMLPHPQACLITGITPQKALAEGVVEAEFIRLIHDEFSQPNTCVVGYNSIRFDDEVTRNTLYRNFYDPYAREWQNGNSRWDIIDMVRMTRTLRPEGINWPNHEDGRPSFKLEQLTVANGIEHGSAHDALSDVIATIELAKLIKNKQPRLYDYVWQHRNKRVLEPFLNVAEHKPVLHVSAKYSADKGCAAIVAPVARDLINRNAIYVYDLNVDPQPLLNLDVEEVRARIFTPTSELPDKVERIPLKAVHTNKCPVVVPLSVLTPEAERYMGVSMDKCQAHLEQIKLAVGLEEKIQQVFTRDGFKTETNPDLMLYSGGFFSDQDRALMNQIRHMSPSQLAQFEPAAQDARIPEMLFCYRARNYPESLTAEEQSLWDEYRLQRLSNVEGGGNLTFDSYFPLIESLRSDLEVGDAKRLILDELNDYGRGLKQGL